MLTCIRKNFIKNRIKSSKLYFHDKNLVEAEIRVYKCEKCDKPLPKYFGYTWNNCNFTHNFKNKNFEFEGLFFKSAQQVI